MVGGRLAGGQPPLREILMGGKMIPRPKIVNVTVVLLRQITVSQKSNHAGIYHPCTRLATQHPRSGTPHHTNSESIAHAPKATGSGEIEATIARQHKSSASHATIEIVAATSQEPCHQSRLRFGGVLVRSVGLAVDTMLPQNLNAGSRAEN